MLKWSNATLSRKICDDRQINATRDRMMHTSSERVRHDFLKAMGARFHVRKVREGGGALFLTEFRKISCF